MNAPALQIWELVADVRNTGRFSPETFDAQRLDGVIEPAVGNQATAFLGFLRKRRNVRDMRTTLERIKDVVEA